MNIKLLDTKLLDLELTKIQSERLHLKKKQNTLRQQEWRMKHLITDIAQLDLALTK